MPHSILIINGPNLNLLGTRQPEVYGSQTLDDLNTLCIETGAKLGANIKCFQSNHEGTIVDEIQAARGNVDAIIINAAAYSHTSVAIHDALVGVSIPTYEVHISDIHAREEFRHFSYVSLVAKEIVVGKGLNGYVELIEKAVNDLSQA